MLLKCLYFLCTFVYFCAYNTLVEQYMCIIYLKIHIGGLVFLLVCGVCLLFFFPLIEVCNNEV